ncbi:MAG: cytochrome c-type biogenesis protein [Alphaproteobacteria bacterium]
MKGLIRALSAAAVSVLLNQPAAAAVMPGETMDDPVLEARARALYQELRCVVCQNQSIYDSDAEIAADLRALVRSRLVAGDDDQAVRDTVVARYGVYVLLEPPVGPVTYALWFGPPALLVSGLIAILVWRRRSGVAVEPMDAPLSDEERARLDELLHDGDRGRRA